MGQLLRGRSLPPQSRDCVPFFRGDRVIRHERFPFLGRLEKCSVSQVTSSLRTGVALTL
jgi:hypothetical protein